MKTRIRSVIIAVFAAALLIASVFAVISMKPTSANADANVFSSGTTKLASYENGVYSLGGDGVTINRARAGMVVNQRLNVYEPIEFRLAMTLDNEYGVGEQYYHNRVTVLTLNRYTVTNGNLDVSSNTFSLAEKGPEGVQFHFIAYTDHIQLTAYSMGENLDSVNLSDGENGKWFESALYNKTVDGCTAKNALGVKIYAIDNNGSESDYDNAQFIRAEFTCFNADNQAVAVATLTSGKLDLKEVFYDEPYLGVCVINEAGSLVNDIPVNVKISEIKNGRVKNITVDREEVFGLKKGVNEKINYALTAWNSSDKLAGVTVSYSSDNTDIVYVDGNGNLTTSADGGYATITVRTSEGNFRKVKVTVYDETNPVITTDLSSVVSSAALYDTIVLPKFEASDNSGEVFTSIDVYPERFNISADDAEISITPTIAGTLTVVYTASDVFGNTATKSKSIEIAAGSDSGNWSKSLNGYAHARLDESDGKVVATLNAGTLANKDTSTALIWNNTPFTFVKGSDGKYTSFSFDMTVNEINEINRRDGFRTRRMLTLWFMESYDNYGIDEEQFSRDHNGIAALFGKDYGITTSLRYRINTGTKYGVSEQDTTAIDTYNTDAESIGKATANRNNMYGQGRVALPWFKSGDALDFSTAFVSGDKISVKLEYFDETVSDPDGKANVTESKYFKLSFNSFKLLIPAKNVRGYENGFKRQAYFGVSLASSDGELEYKITFENFRNGQVDKVVFSEGEKKVCQFGESFSLTPRALGYGGSTVNTGYRFSSSNPSIATVDVNGNVKIVGYGTATILAVSDLESKAARFTVSVDTKTFALPKKEYTVTVGKDFILPIITGAGDKKVPFTVVSGDPFGLLALENGSVQAIRVGDYTLVATYLDHTVTCTIHVVDN